MQTAVIVEDESLRRDTEKFYHLLTKKDGMLLGSTWADSKLGAYMVFSKEHSNYEIKIEKD